MSSKGNILLVANWESDVGYAWWLMENFWVTIATHFATNGRRSFLIYPKITRIPDSVAAAPIQVAECPLQGASRANLRMLRRFIRENDIQYVYLTDAPAYGTLYLLLRVWGVKCIVVHDHTPGDRTRPSRVRAMLKRAIHRVPYYTADHFIAVTEFVRRRMLEVACLPPDKCSCASNGIVPIELDHADRRYAQKTFGIPDDKIIIVSTGRASYYKGIDFFIECANELANRQGHRELHFLYCGDGPDLAAFRQLAKDLQVEDCFTFAGKRSDIRRILPSCHIGFHAATGEVGYSLSILEYMSAGLATIVPNRPSTSLAICDGRNGILYQPRDLTSATGAIVLALDENERETLGRNAAALIKKQYDIKLTNERIVAILEPLFGSQRKVKAP